MLGVTFDGLASYLRGRRNTSLRGTETGDKHWPNDNLFSAASLPLVYLSTTTFCANLVRMGFSLAGKRPWERGYLCALAFKSPTFLKVGTHDGTSHRD